MPKPAKKARARKNKTTASTTISLDPEFLEAARAQAKREHHRSFSAWVTMLIDERLKGPGGGRN